MGDNHNLDPVATSIENKFRPLPTLFPDYCIYRVSQDLRQVNEDAYRPSVVSIGPFYHNDPKLQPMQDHKLRYLQSFLKRNVANNMDHYIRVIRQRQQDIYNCYIDLVNPDDDTFIEMVFIDVAFIIELFLRNCFPDTIPITYHLFDWMINLVVRDIIVEENQLPFFILNEVYNLAFPPSPQRVSFIHLTYNFLIANFLIANVDSIPDKIAKADIKHFVDFVRVCHLPSALRRESNHNENEQTDMVRFNVKEPNCREHPNCKETYAFPPRITELSEAGVRFKVSASNNLLDISFTDGELEIPKLIVEDHTETYFRNIMVFEQYHHYSDSYIVDYLSFMDDLIDTPKDVEILIKNGILVDWLGSNEDVAKLFNNINKQTMFNAGNFYYSNVCKNLNAYVNSRWHRWRAILKRKYFNHPWAAISVIYAIVILILTLLQTICSFTKK